MKERFFDCVHRLTRAKRASEKSRHRRTPLRMTVLVEGFYVAAAFRPAGSQIHSETARLKAAATRARSKTGAAR